MRKRIAGTPNARPQDPPPRRPRWYSHEPSEATRRGGYTIADLEASLRADVERYRSAAMDRMLCSTRPS